MEEQEELSKAISSRFEIDVTGNYSLDDLKQALFYRIRELLDKNVERLLSMLYRVDLSQNKLDEIFQNESKEDIAEKIAEAVIERQLEKIKTRAYYKTKEGRIPEE
jgi:response regulator of citrate/malate metabolism